MTSHPEDITQTTKTPYAATLRDCGPFMGADEIPHDDMLLSPNELAAIVGLNHKAIREALKGGLKYVEIGTGRKPFRRTTLRWWREYLDMNEQTAKSSRKAREIAAEHPGKGNGLKQKVQV